MRTRAALRVAPAVWGLPVFAFIGLRFVSLLEPPETGPYPLILTALGAWGVVYIAPAFAACAAWEAGRLRRSGWLFMPHARPLHAWSARALAPTLTAAWIVLALAVAYPFYASGHALWPEWSLVGVAMVIVLGHVLAGWALGAALPTAIAVPTSLTGSLLWFIVPAASGPPWVQQLTGTWGRGCCRLHEDIAAAALWGPLILSLGVSASAVLIATCAAERRPWRHWIARFGPLALALLIGRVTVQPLGESPAEPRPPTDLVCQHTEAATFCVWPENRERLPVLQATASVLLAGWQGSGVPLPGGFTEQRSGAVPGGFLSFRMTTTSERDDIVASLSDSRIGVPPECPDRADGRPPHAGNDAYVQLMPYLAVAGGMSADGLAERFPPEQIAAAREAQAMAPAERSGWVSANLQAWRSCDVPAVAIAN